MIRALTMQQQRGHCRPVRLSVRIASRARILNGGSGFQCSEVVITPSLVYPDYYRLRWLLRPEFSNRALGHPLPKGERGFFMKNQAIPNGKPFYRDTAKSPSLPNPQTSGGHCALASPHSVAANEPFNASRHQPSPNPVNLRRDGH